MKKLLIFFTKVVVLSIAFAALWPKLLCSPYLVGLSKAGDLIMALAGFDSVTLRAQELSIAFVETDAVLRERTIGSIDGLAHTFNFVPMAALLLATPARWLPDRLTNFAVGLGVLFCTHLAHLAATFFSLTHGDISIATGGVTYYLRLGSYYALHLVFGFWEMAGRMLTPFVIWGVLYPEFVFGRKGLLGMTSPAPSAESDSSGESDDS